jgi:hypothetical protein
MTYPLTFRTVSSILVAAALLICCLTTCTTAAAQKATPAYQLSVFAQSANGYSQPDSLVQWRNTVIVGFQNHVAKDGSARRRRPPLIHTNPSVRPASFNFVPRQFQTLPPVNSLTWVGRADYRTITAADVRA